LIHYVMAEARAAGIEHFVLVTGRGKTAMEDYFDHHIELQATLEAKKKNEILDQLMADLPKEGEISYVRQMAPLGLGHAVWCARDIIGDEPFAVLLPDMIMDAEPGCTAQMLSAYEQTGGSSIIAVEPCPIGMAHQYGIVALESQNGRLNKMTGMVEKPAPGTEPSNLFISGRYVLTPDIFEVLNERATGAGGEIQLTDAMLKRQAWLVARQRGDGAEATRHQRRARDDRRGARPRSGSWLATFTQRSRLVSPLKRTTP
jgi:UTP--glucose-1-phosphate uridylyltransferase